MFVENDDSATFKNLQPEIIKLIVLGESRSGKSSIISRFLDDLFTPVHITTIGIDFRIKKTYFKQDDKIHFLNLQIWDTAGQERFMSIVSHYYRSSLGAFVVFDLGERDAYELAKSRWIPELRKNAPNCKLILLGNKCETPHDVPHNEIVNYCISRDITYIEVSAKEDINIKMAFECLLRQVMSDYVPNNPKSITSVNVVREGDSKRKCC